MIREITRVIWSSLKLQIIQSFSRSMFKFTIIASPIFTGLLLGFVYAEKSSQDFVSYVMIGTATTTMWLSIAFSSAGDIARERYMGALQQVFNSPQDFYYIMFGKVLGNTILGTISMILSFIFVNLIFNVPIEIVAPYTFFTIFIISILSYMSIAQMLAGLLAISRQTRMLMNSMDFPIFLLTGSIFPISILPKFLQVFSYLLSPTYAIHLLRMCVRGEVFTLEFFSYGVGLIIITLIYYLLSKWIFKMIEIKARQDATLEVV